jgi:Na+-transporting NADH:ubiquinone oxidoreductase subunit C
VEERKKEDGSIEYFRVAGEGAEPTKGYVFIREGAGLWGTIVAAVGLDSELEHITGVAFLRQNETPGLGARITEEWFTTQFVGKQGPLTMVPEGEPAGETEFDAITGATITATAVQDLVNAVIQEAAGIAAEEK